MAFEDYGQIRSGFYFIPITGKVTVVTATSQRHNDTMCQWVGTMGWQSVTLVLKSVCMLGEVDVYVPLTCITMG